jgi:hypothetical protein
MFTGYRYWGRKSQAYPERLKHFQMKSFESLIVKRRNKYLRIKKGGGGGGFADLKGLELKKKILIPHFMLNCRIQKVHLIR